MAERSHPPRLPCPVLGSFVALAAGATLRRSDRLNVPCCSIVSTMRSTPRSSRNAPSSSSSPVRMASTPSTRQPFGDDVRAIFEDVPRALTCRSRVRCSSRSSTGPTTSLSLSDVELYRDHGFVDEVAALAEARGVGGRRTPDPCGTSPSRSTTSARPRGVFVIANFVRGEREEVESTIRVAAAVMAGILMSPPRPRVVRRRAPAPSDTPAHRGRRSRSPRPTSSAASPCSATTRSPALAHRFNAMLDRLARRSRSSAPSSTMPATSCARRSP